MLGRLTSETNPETANTATAYVYDSDSTCTGGYPAGNAIKRTDAAGNVTCIAYDQLHRPTSSTYPSGPYSTSTDQKYYVYDAATVGGSSMQYTKARLAEAYTCPPTGGCSTKKTDEGFSYSVRGDSTDFYEATPNSGSTYYHITATPWANGALDVLSSNISGLPTLTYAPDGEGRISTVSAGSGQNPVTSTSYNPASQVTALTFGSLDNDVFTFDPNTNRMTQYQYNVGTGPTQTVQGNLTWNANGTLQQLAITDPLNSSDTQTCTYSYDDLARVATGLCGASIFAQDFAYDPFGNIYKTVPTGSTGMSFNPSYDYTNYTNRMTSTPFTYDGNEGNLTADSAHTYSWDAEGKLITVDSGTANAVCITYDALGRMAEKGYGSSTCNASYRQVVYDPLGRKLAMATGGTLFQAFVPLVGGAQAVYASSGLSFYRHGDWLGSSRLETTPSRTMYYSVAYAPFGEPYAGSGTQDLSFTGQLATTESFTVPGGAGGLYDFLFRRQTPVQGRWLSPDPAGLGAVNPGNPQSWNRYAYVNNNPLSYVDALGLFCVPGHCGDNNDEYYDDPADFITVCAQDGCGGPGGGYKISDPGPPRLHRQTQQTQQQQQQTNNVCDPNSNAAKKLAFAANTADVALLPLLFTGPEDPLFWADAIAAGLFKAADWVISGYCASQ